MEGQQYLDQISELSRPASQTGGKGKFSISNILSSKFFIVGAIGIGVLILVIVIGAILGSNKNSEQELCGQLKYHLDGTTEVIQEYQQYIKSSSLRSSSASLQGVLSNTSNQLTTYIESTYSENSKEMDKKFSEEATLAQDELNNELFEAKINGNLDRIYAHKMAYEISLFTTEETRLLDMTEKEDLKNILTESYDSLNNLYGNFNDFSETKN